ncbi:MAG: PQQ-binding-like beta-propeller repeat protein, partial [Planctomycetota bacterium]
LIRAAIDSADYDELASLVLRFAQTDAGRDGALVLARQYADQGEHGRAARLYEQLARSRHSRPEFSVLAAASFAASGDNTSAARVLQPAAVASARVESGGQATPVRGLLDAWRPQLTRGNPSARVAETSNWLTEGGGPQRLSTTRGGLPHSRIAWGVELLSPSLQSLHDSLLRAILERKRYAVPAASPIAAGRYVVSRTATGLLAVDFETGKRLWKVDYPEPIVQRLLQQTLRVHSKPPEQPTVEAFSRRVWLDKLYSSLSSDGERVFALTPDGSQPNQAWNARPRMGRGIVMLLPSNTLNAYSIDRGGDPVWSVSALRDDEKEQSVFFLGTPLAVEGVLYCMAEVAGGALHLVAFDAASGEELWRQHLASLENSVQLNPGRGMVGATPSYDSGFLVCPTGVGFVVGFDLAKQTLAWAYRYDSDDSDPAMARAQRLRRAAGDNPSWAQNGTQIANGRVWLTPPDSNTLHCLDLTTGKQLWKRPRGQDFLSVAGLADSAVLVGSKGVQLINPSTGDLLSTRPIGFPSDYVPTGSGFVSGTRYFLPVYSASENNAAVVSIDPSASAVTISNPTQDSQPIGNLICHNGAILSQDGVRLKRYDQVEVLRQRALAAQQQDPGDAAALRVLGEIAYGRGDNEQALRYLIEAWERSPDSALVQSVLAECLVGALDSDFAAHRDRLPILRRLAATRTDDRLAMLRIECEGALATGDPLAAFDACLKLFTSDGFDSADLDIRGRRQVRVEPWLRAQSKSIWDEASPDQRQQIEAKLAAVLDQADQSNSSVVSGVPRPLAAFGDLPLMQPRWLPNAEALVARGDVTRGIQFLLASATHGDERNDALRLLTDSLRNADRATAADSFARRLDQTDDPPVSTNPPHTQSLDWPLGSVEVSVKDHAVDRARVKAGMYQRLLLESSDPVVGSGPLLFSRATSEIIGYDSLGRRQFSTLIGSQVKTPRIYGRSHGGLLVVSVGAEIIAFDTLAEGTPVLWRTGLSGSLGSASASRARLRESSLRRPGSSRPPRLEYGGTWIGVLGPLNEAGCVLQSGRTLLCLDPMTGEKLWSRDDVPAGCDLIGDHQVIVCTPRGKNEATVYSMVDGRALGRCTTPNHKNQLATRGRALVTWKLSNKRRVLASVDAVTGAAKWRQEFDSNSVVDIAENRYVAVAEPSGGVFVIDAENGARVVERQDRFDTKLVAVHLVASPNSFLLATHQDTPNKKPVPRRTVLDRNDFPNLSGKVFLFDRNDGSMRWQHAAQVYEQRLMLAQPQELPIIVLVGSSPGTPTTKNRSSINLLILERATGRLIAHEQQLENSHIVEVSISNAEQREISIDMTKKSMQLRFAEGRRPPEPPYMDDGFRGPASGGLFRVFQNAINSSAQ